MTFIRSNPFFTLCNATDILRFMNGWAKYGCKIPETVCFSSKQCRELLDVHHVVHLAEARRILEDGCIRAGLINDESLLNDSRICVAWLSANTWAAGSIYGTIQFTFEWSEIIKGRDVYWVEAIEKYNPPAYRLLLTDRDLSNSNEVRKYNPGTDDGPLKYDGERWCWNDNFTSEFMVEADLNLDKCKKINFITHNDTFCRKNSRKCPEKNPCIVGAQVMAFILGNDIHVADKILLCDRHLNKLVSAGENGVSKIWFALGGSSINFTGGIMKPDSRLVFNCTN